MPDLADLYPGFASKWLDTTAGRIFARTGGEGPPLLLLHGYPQTNVMWHRVAPTLAQHFSLIIPDLPGYGWSDAPQSDAEHAPYTKRAMASAMIEAMEALGHVRFRLAGHDRGGRVAYRLALDHPGRLEKLATLDIVPTWAMWHHMDARLANRAWHWMFLAQPAPFPETMIGKDPLFYFDSRAAAGTKVKSLAAFDPRALAHYHAFFNDPVRIHATCEDYRAGRTHRSRP
jgi:haloacetate dehalogenase